MGLNRDKKQRAMAAITTAAAVFAMSAGLLTGCSLEGGKSAEAAAGINTASTAASVSTASIDKIASGKAGQAAPKTGESSGSTVYTDFKALMDKQPSPSEVLKYLNENISKVSREEASLMAVGLESVQLKEFSKLQAKFNASGIQENLIKVYTQDFDLKSLDGISDRQTKDLLEETRDGGFKVETAEGMFFPVIDYSVYNNFSGAVTPDMKDYFSLMAVESGKMPAKDAALVISWDEMVNRAMAQQKFLDTWKDSPKAGEVGRILKNYTSFTLYGLNNTPLFEYDTGKMNQKAREAYEKAVQNGGEGKYFNILVDYMKKIKENNFKLTDSLKKYREGISTES